MLKHVKQVTWHPIRFQCIASLKVQSTLQVEMNHLKLYLNHSCTAYSVLADGSCNLFDYGPEFFESIPAGDTKSQKFFQRRGFQTCKCLRKTIAPAKLKEFTIG